MNLFAIVTPAVAFGKHSVVLVQVGELSGGRQALERIPVAPNRFLLELQNCSRRPPIVRVPIVDDLSTVEFS